MPYLTGYGGSGIVKTGSFHPMIDAIDHLSKNRKVDDSVKPDLIVINHGTNDACHKEERFRDNLRDALLRLMEKYRGVPVVYVISFGQQVSKGIHGVLTDFGDIKIVETEDWEISLIDNLHPNAAGAKVAGQHLAEELLKLHGEGFCKK